MNEDTIQEYHRRNREALAFLARAVECAQRLPSAEERVQAVGGALHAYNVARRNLNTGSARLSPLLVWADDLGDVYALLEAEGLHVWSELVRAGLLASPPLRAS